MYFSGFLAVQARGRQTHDGLEQRSHRQMVPSQGRRKGHSNTDASGAQIETACLQLGDRLAAELYLLGAFYRRIHCPFLMSIWEMWVQISLPAQEASSLNGHRRQHPVFPLLGDGGILHS